MLHPHKTLLAIATGVVWLTVATPAIALASPDAAPALVARAEPGHVDVADVEDHADADHGHGGGIQWISPIFGHEGKTGVVWLLINFAVLMYLLNRLLFIPLRRRQAAQHDRIKEELTIATQAREEAEGLIREYRIRMEALDGEVAEILADAKVRAEADRQTIIEAAEREALRIRNAAKATAERDAEQTRRTIEQEVLNRAIGQAERLLRERIRPTDQYRMVDDYIQRLDQLDLGGGVA